MTKFLHLTLVALLALVCNVSVAQTTVTFTAGTDKGTQTNAGNAPDEVSKDGITIKTTTGNSAFGAAQYRFPKSSTTTFTSTVGNITKVEFTCTANGDTKYGPGCFTDPSTGSYTYEGKVGTWTGDASSFTLTASSNQVRATTIVFTISGGSTPTTKVTAPTISGETPFTETTTVTITADEGASIYYTTDGQDPDDRSGIEYTAPFTISETTTVKAIAYTADDQSTISEKKFVKGGQYTGNGTIANPYTTADAVAMNAAGELPADTAYYTGTISSISSIDTGNYGNAIYDITTDGTNQSLTVYRGYYLQAKKFTSEDQIKVGDKVIVKGKLIFYNNQTLEIGTRSFIYSLNGKTTDDTPVEPKDTSKIVDNIAAFKALPNNTDAVLTLKDAQVVYSWTSSNNNNSTYVRDASGAVLLYGTSLDLKTNDVLNGTISLKRSEYNNAVQARINDKTSKDNITVTEGAGAQPKTITVGEAADNVSDLVLISGVKVIAEQGSRSTRYYAVSGNGTLQIYDGFHLGYTFAEGENISVKGIMVQYRDSYEIYPIEDPAQTTGISDVKKDSIIDEDAPVYNLAGQRVSKDYKGVVIQRGRKIIRK